MIKQWQIVSRGTLPHTTVKPPYQHVAMRHLRGGALLPLAVHGSELAGARPPRVPRPRPGPPAQRRLVLAEVRLPVREGEGVQVTAARRSETLKVATKFTEHNILQTEDVFFFKCATQK